MKLGGAVKTFRSKKGNDVVFRYPKWDDLDPMLKFANDLIEEDTYIELSGKPLTRKEEEKWLKESIDQIKKGQKIRIVVEVNGKYAGGGELRIGQKRHAHVAEIGLSLGKNFRDEGIGTVLLATLIEEAKKLGLRILTLNCFENNTRACHIYKKLGFKKAGVIPGTVRFKSEYIGEVKFYLPLV